MDSISGLLNIGMATNVARERWAAVQVVPPERESVLPPAQTAQRWEAIYRLFDATTEAARDEAFAAVVSYFLVNGTSTRGEYLRSVRTAGGIEVEIAAVIDIVGKQEGDIRRFVRGRMQDTYNLLKYNPLIVEDKMLEQKAAIRGLSKDRAWMLADWLSGCPYFIGSESEEYEAQKTLTLRNAAWREVRPQQHRPAIESGRVETVPQTPVGSSEYAMY